MDHYPNCVNHKVDTLMDTFNFNHKDCCTTKEEIKEEDIIINQSTFLNMDERAYCKVVDTNQFNSN